MGKKSFGSDCVSLFMRLLMVDVGCFLASVFIFAISGSSAVRAAVQILCFVVIIAMCYSYCYKVGELDTPARRDAVDVNFNPVKGLLLGLGASIPFIITGVLLVLSKLGLFMVNFVGYYKIINSFFYPFLFSILPIELSIFEISWGDITLALCSLLVIPLLSFFSYLIGYKRISLSELVFYKKKQEV